MIGPVTRETEGATERSRCRPPGAAYWLITKTANGRVGVLTLDCGTGEALPVFSHAEEADMFLRFGQAGDEWRVTESRAGGLISVLYGPCAGVKEVALDPLPEMVARGTVCLVTIARDRFMDHLANARRRSGLPARIGHDLRKGAADGRSVPFISDPAYLPVPPPDLAPSHSGFRVYGRRCYGI